MTVQQEATCEAPGEAVLQLSVGGEAGGKMFYFVWQYNNILTLKMLQMPPFCMLIFKNFPGADNPGPPLWASRLRR